MPKVMEELATQMANLAHRRGEVGPKHAQDEYDEIEVGEGHVGEAAKTRSSSMADWPLSPSLPLALGWDFVRAAAHRVATGESSLLPLPLPTIFHRLLYNSRLRMRQLQLHQINHYFDI